MMQSYSSPQHELHSYRSWSSLIGCVSPECSLGFKLISFQCFGSLTFWILISLCCWFADFVLMMRGRGEEWSHSQRASAIVWWQLRTMKWWYLQVGFVQTVCLWVWRWETIIQSEARAFQTDPAELTRQLFALSEILSNVMGWVKYIVKIAAMPISWHHSLVWVCLWASLTARAVVFNCDTEKLFFKSDYNVYFSSQ